MEENEKYSLPQLAFKLFKDMQQDNLEYTYRGSFSTSISDNILSLAENNLDDSEDSLKIKKRVYFIMVEGLQNITRHQSDEADAAPAKPGLFVIQRKKTSYFITTGNLIRVENIPKLKSQLEKINSLDPIELKKYYREILEAGNMSEKGGAGLGLIEMARKSGSKLLFDFNEVDQDYSYFYLQTEVPLSKSDSNSNELGQFSNDSLDNIKDLHEILNQYDIVLNFNGIFNQDNLLNLLTIIERQMKGSVVLKFKIFNVMVEMLQNIVRHADHHICNGIEGNYGIFFISEHKDNLLLTSGNYIKNEKIEKLRNRIELVNRLDSNGLNELYKSTLMKTDSEDHRKTGLGIVDMRIKSKNKFEYAFHPVDDEKSFFGIQVTIGKQDSGGNLSAIIIRPGKDTPGIILDPENDLFRISDNSMMEIPYDFYLPIIKWMNEYVENPNMSTVFEFKLEFFNTSTVKQLAVILGCLNTIAEKSQVLVKWYSRKEDRDNVQIAKRLEQLFKLDFHYFEKE